MMGLSRMHNYAKLQRAALFVVLAAYGVVAQDSNVQTCIAGLEWVCADEERSSKKTHSVAPIVGKLESPVPLPLIIISPIHMFPSVTTAEMLQSSTDLLASHTSGCDPSRDSLPWTTIAC